MEKKEAIDLRGTDAWQALVREYPDLAKTISGSIENLLSQTKLDEKTRQLIYIAVQTARCYPLAVEYHVPLAMMAGATVDEIVGAAAIAVTAAGPKGFVTCFPRIMEAARRGRPNTKNA